MHILCGHKRIQNFEEAKFSDSFLSPHPKIFIFREEFSTPILHLAAAQCIISVIKTERKKNPELVADLQGTGRRNITTGIGHFNLNLQPKWHPRYPECMVHVLPGTLFEHDRYTHSQGPENSNTASTLPVSNGQFFLSHFSVNKTTYHFKYTRHRYR